MLHSVEVDLGSGRVLTIESGKMAKQANGSVIIRSGESVVLVTACTAPEPKPNANFFPLTVDYREYTYSAGRFPGGFIKREGRPTEKEILTSRLIDRPIRPLFPEGYSHETQVIGMVLSADPVRDQERRPLVEDVAHPAADQFFGLRVDRRGRVVEDEDARVAEDRAGDRQPLLLSAGKR